MAECNPGYYGEGCVAPCPSGLFGDNCGGHCSPLCYDEECNHVFGCPQSTTILSKTSDQNMLKPQGWTQTSASDLDQFTKTSNTILFPLEKSTFFIAEKPETEIAFSSLHLIIVFCIIICMFLILIMLQFCKNVMLIKCRRGNQETGNKNRINTQEGGPSSQSQLTYDRTNTEPSESIRKNPIYTPLEAEYSEISESFKKTKSDYSSRLGNCRPSSMKLCSTSKTNNTSFPVNTDQSRIEADRADTYINPIFS